MKKVKLLVSLSLAISVATVGLINPVSAANYKSVNLDLSDVLDKFKEHNYDSFFSDIDENEGKIFVSGSLSDSDIVSDDNNELFDFIKENQSLFDCENLPSNVKVEKKEKDELGYTHIILNQCIDNIPIQNKSIELHCDNEGKVINVTADVEKDITSITKMGDKNITASDAAKIAAKEFKFEKLAYKPRVEKIAYIKDGQAYETYKVNIKFYKPDITNYDVYVEVSSGNVIGKEDKIRRDGAVTGTGVALDGTTKKLNMYQRNGQYELRDVSRSTNGPSGGGDSGDSGDSDDPWNPGGGSGGSDDPWNPGGGSGGSDDPWNPGGGSGGSDHPWNPNDPDSPWLPSDPNDYPKDPDDPDDGWIYDFGSIKDPMGLFYPEKTKPSKKNNYGEQENSSIITYTANNRETQPGSVVTSSTNKINSSDKRAAVSAHYYAEVVYNFYYNLFGRKSLDNRGMNLISTVNYGRSYNNAFWDGSQMVYGDGDGREFSAFSGDLDVVGHEMTHGVTTFTADLNYQDQSGALNESMSDVMGVLIQTYDRYNVQNGGSWKFNPSDWVVGDDIYTPNTPGDALRSLKDPTLYDQPDNMNSYNNTREDNGGVHINSGIPNKAAYLIAKDLGCEKTARIYYRALANYMTKTTNFKGARDALMQAAKDLYGSNESSVVSNAFKSVGVK